MNIPHFFMFLLGQIFSYIIIHKTPKHTNTY